MRFVHKMLIEQRLRMLDDPSSLVSLLTGPLLLSIHVEFVLEHHEHCHFIMWDSLIHARRYHSSWYLSTFLGHDTLDQ